MSHSWEKALITPEQSIKDALGVIDREALRVALVVDNNVILKGIVTDGDVRRGILSGLSVNESVSKVMNTSPVVANKSATKDELIELMNKLDLLSIPIVDNGKIIGLQTLHDTLVRDKKDNPVFIMAGGFGTRLRPLTDNCPKPMLKIGNKPILEILLQQFIEHGFHKFFISTHYLPDVITDYFGDGSRFGVDIQYVYEETPLGTGGALGLLPDDALSLPLIMINGDILTKVDFDKLLHFHEGHDVVSTMCVREYEYQVPFGVIESDGLYIEGMIEKPLHRFFVNAGVYVVDPKVCASLVEASYIDMPSLLERHISNGDKVLQFPIHEYWLDIGRMDDFKRAQMDAASLGLGE
jgi:dTDP-glucose pyrophosphorylase